MLSRAGAERDLVHAIRDELQIFRVGESALPRVVRLAHELLRGELVWTHRPARTLTGWQLENEAACAADERLLARFAQCVASVDGEFAWFRPSAPERKQRNRVVESLTAVRRERPGFFESSRLYQECLEPLGYHEHYQLRVLVCDGAELLAWFGLFQRDEPTPRQHELLTALVPALRKRLALERTLASAQLRQATLAASLEHIAAPCFITDHRGRIQIANTAAQALLAEDRASTLCALERQRCADDVFALANLPGAQLLILRDASSMRARALHVARRWALTPRQSDVLGHVIAGHANITIAELLGISVRAVEYHLTAILARAGVPNRAALVARVAWEAAR